MEIIFYWLYIMLVPYLIFFTLYTICLVREFLMEVGWYTPVYKEPIPSHVKLAKSYEKIHKWWIRKQRIRKFLGMSYEEVYAKKL
jgi:hypothetical protein